MIEIVTRDEGGEPRETKVWIVVVDDAGWVRTNDSRWLANIRRGSPVAIRAKQVELPVRAEERSDPAEFDRVEAAFQAKYGWLQRLMSAFRTTRPTVLRLTPLRAEATSGDARGDRWASRLVHGRSMRGRGGLPRCRGEEPGGGVCWRDQRGLPHRPRRWPSLLRRSRA